MLGRYILDGHEPVPCEDITTWANWLETAHRHVAEDTTPGGARVSTVFIGIDHNWEGGTPLLFETMIFGGPEDTFQDRYSSWDEAVSGHAKALALALSTERAADT